jgi:uracil-DNA glycosylase
VGYGQADGHAFSVPEGCKLPPSLENIFAEIYDDVKQCEARSNGQLIGWCKQGVYDSRKYFNKINTLRLLLNSSLTVREKEPGSHMGVGWQNLTDEIIKIISAKITGVVFMFWGSYAASKKIFVNQPDKHLFLFASHPSPKSAQGFFGKKHFSRCNEYLRKQGKQAIDWNK